MVDSTNDGWASEGGVAIFTGVDKRRVSARSWMIGIISAWILHVAEANGRREKAIEKSQQVVLNLKHITNILPFFATTSK